MYTKTGAPTARDIAEAEPGFARFIAKRKSKGAGPSSLNTYANVIGTVRQTAKKPLLGLPVAQGRRTRTRPMTLWRRIGLSESA